MSLTTNDSLSEVEPKDCLSVLNAAIGPGPFAAARRVMASSDSRSPNEGIALLTAYVSIPDRRVRQAILDTLLAIAAVETTA